MSASPGLRTLLASAVLAVGVPACGGSPTAPAIRHDLTGRWRGFAQIQTTGLPTPLEMTLADRDGQITGTGGGVDCRYFLTCGSFYSYVVSGSHDSRNVTLTGETPDRRTWTLTGTVGSSGLAMSGTITGSDFPRSSWQMTKQPSQVGADGIGMAGYSE
jgi:hypothetical protein